MRQAKKSLVTSWIHFLIMVMSDIIIWDFSEWEASVRSSYSFYWGMLISGNWKKIWEWIFRLDSFIIGGQISSVVSTYTSRLLLPLRVSIICIRWENSYYKTRIYIYVQLKIITSSSQKGISKSRFLGMENLWPHTSRKAFGRWRHCSSMIGRCQDFLA